MSSTSSHGSMSTGSRCSLSASSRGSLSSLNHSASNPDGLHLSNSNEYFPSSYHPVSTTCPPIYETTKLESRLPTPNTFANSNNTQSKGSTSSRDSMSISSMSPPVSPMHNDKNMDHQQWIRGYLGSAYPGVVQSRGEDSQYADTNGVDRMHPCSQVRNMHSSFFVTFIISATRTSHALNTKYNR